MMTEVNFQPYTKEAYSPKERYIAKHIKYG